MTFKVLYSGLYHDDCHPFDALCNSETKVARDPDELKEREAALIIWGGSDIHPDYYKRPMHPSTHPGGQRDKLEWSLMQRAIEMGISIIGVCRGAQMGCAAAGGWLIQDVRGHAGWGGHDVTTFDGKTFHVNSIHHQMMVAEGTEHELVGWSSLRLGEKNQTEHDAAYGIDNNKAWYPEEAWKEPEFLFFPKIRCYAIQWHPEGMKSDSTATQYILNFIKTKEAEYGKRASFPICSC